MREIKDSMPTPAELNALQLNCRDDTFLEVLTGNIRGAILSFQSWVKKISTLKKALLTKQINTLRASFLVNAAQISDLQSELNAILEKEIKEKISSIKLFEGLNSEKPRPIFLSLAKKTSKTDSLARITNSNGDTFNSPGERGEFITSFYENLYKIPADSVPCSDTVISDFLGPEILNSNLVKNSKLTRNESTALELPLSIHELDKSLDKANIRSAAGEDGFSNVLIRKCWQFLRYPLLKYANYCFESGELTSSFKNATIKLIPQKGDSSSLKNWRPISLLSNLYKILLRAINMRLNKIVNRICSRAQKGFNNQRYTEEFLINVWETINYCKSKNIDAAIMAIDMAKAFDTLSNSFLDRVYEFFGFGQNITKWLKLLGTNRTANKRLPLSTF